MDNGGCIAPEIVESLTWSPVEMPAGSTLWFHSRTPHRSGPNTSGQDRRALYPTYNALSEGDLREDYYRRKRAAGKTPLEAVRCLKRRLSDVVFRTMVEDRARANPGGQMGATLTASAVDQIPKANTSDKPQPGFTTEATPPRHLAEAAS